MDIMAQLQAVDREELTSLVRRALRSDTAEIADWDVFPIYGGAGDGSSVYRWAGTGRAHGETVPWSLVLKVISRSTSNDEPSAWNYWKREVLAYQSGLLVDLPGGLQAARCLGVEDTPDSAWIWLEEVTDLCEHPWPLWGFRLAARQLGRFNGAYLMGRPMPSYPWMSRG